MITIANLKYIDPANTLIDMDVTRDGETFPFTYSPSDPASTAAEVRDLLALGGYQIAAYAAPSPLVPSTILLEQFLIGLARNGVITVAEAIAWARGGTPPAAVQAWIDSLATQTAKDEAAVYVARAWRIRRDSLLVAYLAGNHVPPLTAVQVDNLFIAWGAI